MSASTSVRTPLTILLFLLLFSQCQNEAPQQSPPPSNPADSLTQAANSTDHQPDFTAEAFRSAHHVETNYNDYELASMNGQPASFHPKGIGIIYPQIIYGETGYPGDTTFHLRLFTDVTQQQYCVLSREEIERENNTPRHQLIVNCGGEKKLINTDRYVSFVVTGYKDRLLQYYARRNNMVKVYLNRSAYWIKESDLDAHGFTYPTYAEYLHQMKSGWTSLEDQRLNIRTGASTDSPRALTINNDHDETNGHHLVELLSPVKDQWVKVKISQYSSRDAACSQSETPKIFEGYTKVIDDSGFPNLWQYSDPCG